MFNFNKRFQIHDDIDILKRMGLLFGKMTHRQNHPSHISNLIVYIITIFFFIPGLDKGECTEEDIEKVKSMVPKSLESYVER